MNKTPLNFTVALMVARELTKSGEPHYVTNHVAGFAGQEQRVCSLSNDARLTYVDGPDPFGSPLQCFMFDRADESVRIVRKGYGWGAKQTIHGWEVYEGEDFWEDVTEEALRAYVDMVVGK